MCMIPPAQKRSENIAQKSPADFLLGHVDIMDDDFRSPLLIIALSDQCSVNRLS